MDENQPNKPEEKDEEWEAVKGVTPGLEDEELPKEPDPTDDEDIEGKGAKPDAGDEVKPEEKDEEPKAETESKPDDKDGDDKEDDKPAVGPKIERPRKYIPISQYTDEKKGWREKEEAFNARIAELEALNQSHNTDKQSKIKAYAEKYGLSEESVVDLADILKDDEKKARATIDPEVQAKLDQADEVLSQQMFEQEFEKDAIPAIKSHFPNATPEQIKAIKKEVEQIACTDEFLDKSLDFVVFKSKDSLASHFKEAKPGVETRRPATERGNVEYTAKDFENGKTSFKTLVSLPVDQQTKIVEGMDVKTYSDYERWLDQNQDLVIDRGGRKIRV